MIISKKGLDLLKSFEGLRLVSYRCPVGIWTIGYGTTQGIKEGMRITEKQAEIFLQQDLYKVEQTIQRLVKVPITQCIFDALAAFIYNVGGSAFEDSTLLNLLNQKKYSEAGDQLLRWDKAGDKELEGLTRRRRAERKLFYSQPFPGSKK
jgi:lysozyme